MSTPHVSIEDVYGPELDDQATQERQRYEAVAATIALETLKTLLIESLQHECPALDTYLATTRRIADHSGWMDTPTAYALAQAIAQRTAQILDDLVGQAMAGTVP